MKKGSTIGVTVTCKIISIPRLVREIRGYRAGNPFQTPQTPRASFEMLVCLAAVGGLCLKCLFQILPRCIYRNMSKIN